MTKERDAEALRMRAAGFSYDDIAKRVGFSNRGSAWRAVERAQADVPVADPEAVALEQSRLDMLQRALMSKALQGDVPSVLAVLKISDQRARLAGMYVQAATVGAEPAAKVVDPVDDIAARRAARRAAAGS